MLVQTDNKKIHRMYLVSHRSNNFKFNDSCKAWYKTSAFLLTDIFSDTYIVSVFALLAKCSVFQMYPVNGHSDSNNGNYCLS